MLGSVASTDDILQEAWLRFSRAEDVDSPRAFLSTVVTRLAIDELKSARVRRETYSGIWLPEPVVTDSSGDPYASAELGESLSMAFLLVLDRLNPVERAVFLLHDVFGYDFAEIAPIVERSQVNCRQIAARARKRVREDRPRLDADPVRRERTARRLFDAMTAGDMDALVGLLAHDVTVMGDGGGKAPQWSTPIVGIERVSKLLLGLARQMAQYGLTAEARAINGQPGVILRTAAGEVTNVFELEIVDGKLQTLRGVINPDKLRHLGAVADVRALARPS
jgi:RNA polymerase sigma-70 factor, ECF subfamily